MHLSGLFIYPVKGCRGVAVESAEIDALGLVGDRRFMVVDKNGKFLSQRTFPRMALIEAALTPENLELKAADLPVLSVPIQQQDAPLRPVEIWKSKGLSAEDCGEPASAWLSDFLGIKAHLVRIGRAFRRPIKPERARPGDVVSFADAFPFLIISEASLSDLNGRMETTLPMNRFRPNLVVAGAEAFAEDDWKRFRIGDMVFRTAGACVRCIVTTTDQTTGERGKEPLKTLATYRRDEADATKVIFGQNAIHETKTGVVRVGAAIDLL